ncbi:MAG: PA14 domain-containing protein [Candidatus Omnitrophota bacterium]
MDNKLPKIFFSFLTVLILLFLIIAAPASAGIFYVRPDGNNANSGSANTPQGAFKTIQKAADTLSAGDIAEIQPGTYNEQVTISRSGLANKYITFHANGSVIIDGQNTRPYGVKLSGADYVKLDGFTIRNASDNGIFLDNGATYNIISNNACYSNGASGIRLNLSSNRNTVNSNTCYSNGYTKSAYGDRPCGIYLFNSSSYNTLDSNICRNNSSTGIWLEGSSSYCALKNNKSYSNGYGGIIVVGGTNYNTVSYNLIYSNGYIGVDLSYSAHDNIFKNNTIYNNGSNGIQSNNGGYSNNLKNNIIVNNGLNNSSAYGVKMDSGCSVFLYYNDVYNNGQGGLKNYCGVSTGIGDICLDPLFKSLDSSNPDFLKLKSVSTGDSAESPCIDSGSPSEAPLSGSGKRIDIGVYDLYQHAPIQGGLLAEYYDNKDFTSLKVSRVDPRINFEWRASSPDASISPDTFSIRWQGQIRIDIAQGYTFYALSDDGFRLWIDGNLILDKWYDQGAENQITINLAAGFHDIKCEYYENTGWASAQLSWSAASINKTVIPSDHLYYFAKYPESPYSQGGLKGSYCKFTDTNVFPVFVFSRVDPQINFDWGEASPDSSLGIDKFLIKWKGKIKIDKADTYNFYAVTDDGARLWIDSRLVIDNWRDQGSTETQGSLYISPGLYDIELDYYENALAAVCKLCWSSSTIAKSLIPQANLYYERDNSNEGGLLAEYFDNADFTNPKIKRIEPSINFDWASFAPDSLIQPNTYSIRWTGQVKADYDETYTFYTASDDGVRLWIDGRLLIDGWNSYCAGERSANISLTQGWRDIKVEYRQDSGWADVKIAYSSSSTPKTIIPSDHLASGLFGEAASLNLYSSLDSLKDIESPAMGHSGAVIQTGAAAAEFKTARLGNGILLDGAQDGSSAKIVKFSSADLNPKEGMIEFWFKPGWNSDDGKTHKLLVTDWSWDGSIEILKYSDNALYWKIIKDGTQHAIVSDASRKWNAGEWHHLAFSYGPQGMKFYLDYKEIPTQKTFYDTAPYAGSLPEVFASDLYLGGAGDGTESSSAVFDDFKIYNKQLIPCDTKAPAVEITSHQDNQVVDSGRHIIITGAIDDNYAVVKVNGIDASVSNGIFTAQVALKEGDNVITVTATDYFGNTSARTITVVCRPVDDITPPGVNIFVPVAGSTTRSDIVYGRVSGDAISVKVFSSPQGQEAGEGIPAELLPDFRFIARPPLNEGQNTVIVEAQDEAGNIGRTETSFVYDKTTPKVTIASPADNSTINESPIKVEGSNSDDISFVLVNNVPAISSPLLGGGGGKCFAAEGVQLDPFLTIVTACGYDSNENKFCDSIMINSFALADYELIKISGDAGEGDPERPTAGSNQILKVKLLKNSQPVSGEEVIFSVQRKADSGQEGMSFPPASQQGGQSFSGNPEISVYTDINGEAAAVLTTDTDSDTTNQVECYPANNPLAKAVFYVDTKPGAASILTKITDETITPVPGATIDLIVRLTDQNQNPIQDENVTFGIVEGAGVIASPDLSSEALAKEEGPRQSQEDVSFPQSFSGNPDTLIQTVTNNYGEAKVTLTCPNAPNALTKVKVSTSSLSSTFNITTSAPPTVTAADLINKVNENDSKIQDIKADITVTSDTPWSPSKAQFKIWQKADKQKVEEISPDSKTYIRPALSQVDPSTFMDRAIISYDPVDNMYLVKSTASGQLEEYPYEIDYIDYDKGVVMKTEYHLKENNFETLQVNEYSDFIQMGGIWGFQKEVEKIYAEGKLLYTTTSVYSNIQINTGIPDGEFQ